MPDNDDLLGGGMLSQTDLDALLAAANAGAETADDGWTSDSALEEISSEIGAAEGEPDAPAAPPPPARATPVDLPSFDTRAHSSNGAGQESSGMGRIRDIPLEVTVELGRTRLLIRDIMDLGAGSIIELDKIAGEPVELYANGLLMARGEVVVIDDNFGVRVTEIITAADRSAGKNAHALAA